MNDSTTKTCLFVLIATIVSTMTYGYAMAAEITLSTDETVFEQTSRIFLTGTVDPQNQFYEPVELVIYDKDDTPIMYSQSKIDYNNEFSALITGPLGSFELGEYKIVANHPAASNSASIVIDINRPIEQNKLVFGMAPLEQMNVGITPTNVVCDEQYVLMYNEYRGSPACVTPSTAVVLEDREWGIIL
ncbi:hypothetical protein NKOR_06090 [Candidatus Nitrosopumilus koreensis AR1]|uniref:Uncharacterized protein n=1 Tax=Candidatus Nitrosopumilus koreensis AR1 TaxID=1229908 RepID=K0B9G5_9ARCH|nr:MULTISPECIES: hypothetical protein [Nitrosopumilus]AFS81101.1 hypothetical protein NKOR_06090 [Candidatus Nitrosopumilus koreensis AR1]